MLRKTLFLLAFTVVFASCDSDDELKTEFEIAKAKWESSKIESYSIQENVFCYCAGVLNWELKSC